MSVPRHAFLTALALLALVLLWSSSTALASDFTRFKDLKNEFIKVTDVRERERNEERYVETGGKVTLQQIPHKEVQVTAELIQKPPSTMTTMFDSGSDPYFKICLAPFDAADKALDEDCQSFHFQTLSKGNVGTATFRLDAAIARYEFHLTKKLPDAGSSIKLWVPTDD